MTRTMIDAPTAARAAALWWADAIGAPTFRMVDDSSGPDEQVTGFLASAMAGVIADRYPVSKEAGRAFADALEQIVAEGQHYSTHGLHTDYGPDSALAAAAKAAGVDFSRFPWKTNMRIKDDHVVVSAGYRAAWELVWHAPDWQHPPCHAQRYGDDPESGIPEPRDEICGLLMYHSGSCGDWRPDPKRCASCGGTYSAHYSGAYWEDQDRCRWRDQ